MADTGHLPEPTSDDLRRIGALYNKCDTRGGGIVISPSDVLEVLKLEHQMRAEKMATDRIVLVSWVLVLVTLASVLASVAVIMEWG